MSEEAKVAQATINPIQAKDIRLGRRKREVIVPLPKPPGMHFPEFESVDPVVLKAQSVEHAITCARKVIAMKGRLPHTEQALDLLSMAYAIEHYVNKGMNHEQE